MEEEESKRPWGVWYSLIYDFGGSSEFSRYYRIKLTAYVCMFWHTKIASRGGSAVLFANKKEK